MKVKDKNGKEVTQQQQIQTVEINIYKGRVYSYDSGQIKVVNSGNYVKTVKLTVNYTTKTSTYEDVPQKK